MPLQRLNTNRSAICDIKLESTNSTSKATQSLPLEFSASSNNFSRAVDMIQKSSKKISVPPKLELCPTKDYTDSCNKFRKLPLKRISRVLNSNSHIINSNQNLDDGLMTYNPYLPRQSSFENSLINRQELKMHCHLHLPNALSSEAAKLELQNSFLSAQRQYYLNQRDKI